jgi:hypothetical protein
MCLRALTKLAPPLGVEDRVTWLGAIPRSVCEELDYAAAVVLTGPREEGGSRSPRPEPSIDPA